MIMRQLAIIILTLCTALSANAQWGGKKVKGNGKMKTITRNVGDYDEISIAGFFDVELVKGREGPITIEGEENLLEYIETTVKNNRLKIYVEDGINLKPSSNKGIVITVPFDEIEGVALAGSGDVMTKDTITAMDFEAKLSGSGDLTLEVIATNVEASLAGSGDITLNGTAEYFEASVAGSGDMAAYDLNAKNVEVSVSGSGDAEVYCTEFLKARVVGSGDVSYRGNPKKEDSKVVGSGDIEKG